MGSLVSNWKSEHRAFGALLALLEQQLALLHDGDAPNYEMMLDVVDYIVDYVDRFHHPTEDIVLATVAERVPAAREPLRELMRQHVALVKTGRELRGGLEAAMSGSMALRADIEEQAKRYVDTFREHMYTEEQELFLMASEHLTPQDWDGLGQAARRGEDPLFGERPEQRYRALRQQMSHK